MLGSLVKREPDPFLLTSATWGGFPSSANVSVVTVANLSEENAQPLCQGLGSKSHQVIWEATPPRACGVRVWEGRKEGAPPGDPSEQFPLCTPGAQSPRRAH